MRLIVKLVAAVALLGAASVGAAPSTATIAQPAAKPTIPGDRICENIVETGSRIASKRICMTREQWAQRQRDDREEVVKDQRSANFACTVINTHTPTTNCN